MTKYELIDSITIQVDALVDMRGAEKCRAALEIIGKLSALKEIIANDDKTAEAKEAAMRRQLDKLLPPDAEGDEELIDGKVYKIGEVSPGGEM